jgi:hypothetical protein
MGVASASALKLGRPERHYISKSPNLSAAQTLLRLPLEASPGSVPLKPSTA